MRLLRLLPRPPREGRVRSIEGRVPPEDRGNDRPRRRADPPAGRTSSGPWDRVLRRTIPLDEGQLPEALGAWTLARGSEAHLSRLEPLDRGDGASPDRRRPRFDSWRRRRSPVESGPQHHRHRQGLNRRLARSDGGGAAAGPQDHGHHDVRPCGDSRRADRSPSAPPRAAGPHARVHRFHRVDVPAGEHRARRGRGHIVSVSTDPGGGPGDARQLPERAGELGHPGRQDRPDVSAVRRQRLRQPDD